jgi:YidC/Oxa1 family membrane protein insertase
MEQRNYILRVILFFVLSMAILSVWTAFFAPKPIPAPDQQIANQDENPDRVVDKNRVLPVEDSKLESASKPPQIDQPAVVDVPKAQPDKLVEHQHDGNILLGSLDSQSGYFLQVQLTTSGAAVVSIQLNDPRYLDLTSKDPLRIVGDTDAKRLTLETSIETINALLKKHNTSLRTVDWKVETVPDQILRKVNSAAIFTYTSPDGAIELRKEFKLTRIEKQSDELNEARDIQTAGYVLDFNLTITNRSNQNQTVQYELQGPVGVPLENVENTSEFRNVKMGYFDKEGVPDSLDPLTAQTIVEQDDAGKLDKWSHAIKYIGIDVQYFAAVLVPKEDQSKKPYTAFSQPDLIQRAKIENQSDISVTLTSRELELPANGTLTHSYFLFTGPKRKALLEPLEAADVVDLGFFGIVSKVMLGVLTFLHDYLFNFRSGYGFAIIGLTILVRSCMFPITWKQTKSAQKMKELQPKIAELKKKYAKDKEKFARAQMELFSTHNYNPLAGCLPLFLQLPIFFGLFQALRSAIDLRLAPFLWFDNLAAPDALFELPFALPFLGQDFNLLPILTTCLFIVQQKLFMPPAADEQQAMQQKMMTYFSIFIGFMFYTMPSGLNVYFIASSLWGIGERKLLEYLKKDAPLEELEAAATTSDSSGKKKIDEPKRKRKKGFWDKLLEAADSAAAQTKDSSTKNPSSKSNGEKRKKKNKTRTKR